MSGSRSVAISGGGAPEDDETGGETRDPTGVPNLDEIMGGGLPRGSLTLVMGLPGSGKTTLASQIAFTAARTGRTALILTALSEPTSKLIAHLRAFAFFDPEFVGGSVQFLSLRSALAMGLEATANAIIAEARRIHAGLVMLDGFRGMSGVSSDPQAAREFLYSIGATLSTLGTTTIVTSETDPYDEKYFPETTTSDIILGLHYNLLGVRQSRGIEVIKTRMAAPLPGLHALTLGTDGAVVYPQFEERVATNLLGGDAQTQGDVQHAANAGLAAYVNGVIERASFDLKELDTMLEGGIPRATCALLAGSLGTGKTLLALYFALAGARAGERVVFLSFREGRAQLVQAAGNFEIGADVERELRPGGHISLIETLPIKLNADILADRLLSVLDQTGAQRLVIDSVAELERAIKRSSDPQRLEDYLAALLLAVRSRNITGLFIKESERAVAATLDFSADALSVLAESVLLLQQVAFNGNLHRILSIPKLRFSGHDTSLREFRISAPQGLEVLQPISSEVGVLEGITRRQEGQSVVTSPSREQRRRRRVSENVHDA